MALRRARPGSDSSRELLLRRTWKHPVYPLQTLVSVPFLVVGGVATRLYAPERMTDVLDVLVEAGDVERFYRELEKGGGHRLGGLSIPGSS